MDSTSERRLTTFLDEEEANDYVAPLQKIPENIFNPQYMEDMLTSPSVNKLVKERGLVFEGADIKTPKVLMTQKQPFTKGGTIIPGQSAASKEELAGQLKKAETEGNKQLIASLVETLLSRDLDSKERASYQAQKCQLMMNLGRYSDSREVALDILRNFSNLSDADLLNVLLALSKSRLELGDIDAGYADLMRAQGILWEWEAKNVHGEKYDELKDETNLESWRDSEVDKDLKAAEELKLLYQLRYAKEANSTSTCYVTGGNTQSYLLGLGDANEEAFGLKEKSAFKMLPELRNRKVLQVACGDHHTLALIEGDIYNLYNVQALNKLGRGNFGVRDLFGWGENSCGQITGYETQHNIRKPTVIRHFMGKDIQGIHASRAASICYDRDGNVYEWGHRPSGNLSVEVSFTDKNGIHSVRLGNQFSAILTADDRLLAKGDMSQIFVMHEYREIQKPGLSLKQIECGNSHLVALNAKGEIFAFGRNDIGQLGVGEDTKKLAHLTKIEVPAYQSTPSKIFAFKDISAFINTEQELYMWGGIYDVKSDAKAQWRPFQYELDFGTGINRVNGSGNQIFVLDNTGKTYLWDLGTSSKFKRYSLGEHEHFSELASGKGFQVFIKEYIESSASYVQVVESQTIETFTPISLRVKLMDRSGPHHYGSGYPLRYYVYVSQQAQAYEDLQEKAVMDTTTAPKPKKAPSSTLSILAQGDCIAREAHVKPVEGDDSTQILQLTLTKNSTNYIYVFINEKLVKDAPLAVDIAKSAHQEDREKEEAEKTRMELEMQKAKEEAQQRKLLAAQKENEEKAIRIQETEKRAQETLKEHTQQQKTHQAKVEEERKARKEASVGGGYDMSKIKTTAKPSPLEVRSPTMQKTVNKPSTGSASGSTRSTISTAKSPTISGIKSPTLKMTSPTGLTKSGVTTSTTPASVNKMTSPLQKPGSAPKTGGLQDRKSPGLGGLAGKKSPGMAAYQSKGVVKK